MVSKFKRLGEEDIKVEDNLKFVFNKIYIGFSGKGNVRVRLYIRIMFVCISTLVCMNKGLNTLASYLRDEILREVDN